MTMVTMKTMPRTSATAIFASSLLLLAACDDSDIMTSPSDRLAFEAVESAEALAIQEPGTAVFRDSTTWQEFWKRNTSHCSLCPLPEIDFDNKLVIGLFWGVRSGCSNSVEFIRAISQSATSIDVHVDPFIAELCEAIVYPLQLVTIDRFAARV